MKNFLPKKLSECLRVALRDLKSCMRSNKYQIDMGKWFRLNGGKCVVCMAGSVMAKTCQLTPHAPDPDILYGPDMYPNTAPLSEHDQKRLDAINSLREGRIFAACREIQADLPRFMADEVEVVDFDEDPDQFLQDMKDLADHLEANGL